MTSSSPNRPTTLALFQKRFEGDDCLMELARLRFQQAGLGVEVHAGTTGEVDWILKFLPFPESPAIVHLARDVDWADASGQDRIVEMAERFAGRVQGLVVHDRIEMGGQPEVFLRAACALDSRLAGMSGGPMLFIEYAAGLEPGAFAGLVGSIRELARVSACIDVGHVGIWHARDAFARKHPGQDLCALKSEPHRIPEVVADVEAAAGAALPGVLQLIEAIGPCGKPVHYHLHDGHPLSRFSPFGVSDHLSFLGEIPIDFTHRGRRSLPQMFGPAGLVEIAGRAVQAAGAAPVSFTLEIHPTAGRLSLGDAGELFGHWRDKTNAEQMNHWLAVLRENHILLQSGLRSHQP